MMMVPLSKFAYSVPAALIKQIGAIFFYQSIVSRSRL